MTFPVGHLVPYQSKSELVGIAGAAIVMTAITSGAKYTVPANKVLVAKGLQIPNAAYPRLGATRIIAEFTAGVSNISDAHRWVYNGSYLQNIINKGAGTSAPSAPAAGATYVVNQIGLFVAAAGQTVDVNSGTGYLYGILYDAP